MYPKCVILDETLEKEVYCAVGSVAKAAASTSVTLLGLWTNQPTNQSIHQSHIKTLRNMRLDRGFSGSAVEGNVVDANGRSTKALS